MTAENKLGLIKLKYFFILIVFQVNYIV